MNGTAWDGSYALLPNVPTAWSIAGSGDFNDDGNPDIVWQNTATGDRSVWFMTGTTWNGGYALLPNVSIEWSIAGVGDFNADGNPDLVWQNTVSGDRSVWFMNDSQWNGSYLLLPRVATAWSIAAVGDFNADAKPDLVWQNTTDGQRSIWYMNASGWSGTYALLPTIPAVWRIAAAADFDGDADPDLVWQNLSSGERSIWLMNGAIWDGTYASLPTVSTAWRIAGVLSSQSTAPAGGTWIQLGADVPGVSAVAIASDGVSLYRFYCVPSQSDPIDEGQLDKWNGTTWVAVSQLTHECHEPEVEVEGSLWVAGFETDNPDFGWASNANGPAVVFQGNFLVHQWGIHVAVAQGRPYGAFAADWSDGHGYPYTMLHVISPIPPGNSAELNGGWGGETFFSISRNLGLAGDATGWYAVTRSQDALWVKKGFHNGTSAVRGDLVGYPFNAGIGDPVVPEIVVYGGQPTVAWLENGQTEIWVGQWNGVDWIGLGSGGVTTGYIGRTRVDAYQSNLYVMQLNSAQSPLLAVSRFNGTEWATLPDPAGAGEVPTFSTGDIAALSSGPVVAYTSGGVMKVKQLQH